MAQGAKYQVFRAKMYQTGKSFYLTEQNAVVKVLRSHVASEEDWVYSLECLKDAKEYAGKFAKILAGHDMTEKLLFVTACPAPMDSVSKLTSTHVLRKKKLSPNEYVLIEAYIRGKIKSFVSVIGKTMRKNLMVLEAFSHFTYWDSGGDLVVCDLKGSHKGDIFRLTVPCIHSKSKRYGSSDMGEDGIILFLETHQCNELCAEWTKRHTQVGPLPSMFREGNVADDLESPSTNVKRPLYPSIEASVD